MEQNRKVSVDKQYLFKFNNFTIVNSAGKFDIYSAYADVEMGNIRINIKSVSSKEKLIAFIEHDYDLFIKSQIDTTVNYLDYNAVATLIFDFILNHIETNLV